MLTVSPQDPPESASDGDGMLAALLGSRSPAPSSATETADLLYRTPLYASQGDDSVLQRGAIRAILFAEFDNTHGPVIAHRWPTDWLCSDDGDEVDWNSIGLYDSHLIPNDALTGRMCTWRHKHFTFLSFPMTFNSKRYFRNKYRTNLIFCFDADSDSKPFQDVIRKVSHCFQVLEEDSGWLYRQSRAPTNKGIRSARPAAPAPGRTPKWALGEKATVMCSSVEELEAATQQALLPLLPREQAKRYLRQSGLVTRVWPTDGVLRISFTDLSGKPESEFPFTVLQGGRVDDEADAPPVTPSRRGTRAREDAFPDAQTPAPAPTSQPSATSPATAASGPAPPPVRAGATEVKGQDGEVHSAQMSVTEVLQRLLAGLNKSQECKIEIDESSLLAVKYFSAIPAPKEVHPWDVPVLLQPPSEEGLAQWDLALQHLIPRVDGERTIASLAHELQMPPENACCAVRHLLYYRVADTVDAFQWTNLYSLVPRPFDAWLHDITQGGGLGSSPEAQDAERYASRDAKNPVSIESLIWFYGLFGTPAPAPPHHGTPQQQPRGEPLLVRSVERVFRMLEQAQQGRARTGRQVELYASWRHALTTSATTRISVRHAIAYGVLKGLLRRVHEYPIFDSAKASKNPDKKAQLESPQNRELYNMLMSQGRCIDDICTALNYSLRGKQLGLDEDPTASSHANKQWQRSDVMEFSSCFTVYCR